MANNERVISADLPTEYAPPSAQEVPVKNVDRATMCACKAGDDNPY